jgi:hypothetical protein
MQSLYLLAISLGGAVAALFAAAGWSSYKHKKIPERPVLFRWFVAGLVTAGLIAYVWIFGAGGDVSGMIRNVGESLEMPTVASVTAMAAGVLASLKSVTDSATPTTEKEEDGGALNTRPPALSVTELTVGMPTF